METISALLAICAGNSPGSGEFPAPRPVTRSFYVFFDLHLNKWLSKQWWGWWFETPSRPLWRQCNGFSDWVPLWKQSTWISITAASPKSMRVWARDYDWAFTGNVLLIHLGRVTYVCVSELTSIGADNGLAPARRQAIIWTNAGILLIGPSETNFSEILFEIHTFSFKKRHLKMSSGKWGPFCLGLNVLTVMSGYGHHFVDIFKCIFLKENHCILIKCPWSLSNLQQISIGSGRWLGTEQVTSHLMIQWWPSSLMPYEITRGPFY